MTFDDACGQSTGYRCATCLCPPLQGLEHQLQGWIQDFPKGGANDGKGEWGVPPPTQSREVFAIIVCD